MYCVLHASIVFDTNSLSFGGFERCSKSRRVRGWVVEEDGAEEMGDFDMRGRAIREYMSIRSSGQCLEAYVSLH